MFKRILLAYDGSESGRRALLECGEVAGLTRATIKLLAVTPSMPPVYVGEGFVPTDSLDAQKERYRDVLDDGIRQLEAKGFACQGQLSFGEPVDEIARVATEWEADLIVMGHRRAGSWAERWWRGSLSKSLVEIAPCSVLIAVVGTSIPKRSATPLRGWARTRRRVRRPAPAPPAVPATPLRVARSPARDEPGRRAAA